MSKRLDGSEFRPFIACIDFDATIVNTSPDMGIIGMRDNADKVIRKLWNQGVYIIINTCRALDTPTGFDMEKFLFENKIPYHQINNQSVWSREDWAPASRKLFGEVYIDDKNLVNVACGEMQEWIEIDKIIQDILDKDFEKFGVKSDRDFTYIYDKD